MSRPISVPPPADSSTKKAPYQAQSPAGAPRLLFDASSPEFRLGYLLLAAIPSSTFAAARLIRRLYLRRFVLRAKRTWRPNGTGGHKSAAPLDFTSRPRSPLLTSCEAAVDLFAGGGFFNTPSICSFFSKLPAENGRKGLNQLGRGAEDRLPPPNPSLNRTAPLQLDPPPLFFKLRCGTSE